MYVVDANGLIGYRRCSSRRTLRVSCAADVEREGAGQETAVKIAPRLLPRQRRQLHAVVSRPIEMVGKIALDTRLRG